MKVKQDFRFSQKAIKRSIFVLCLLLILSHTQELTKPSEGVLKAPRDISEYSYDVKQIKCLAYNIYYEAKGEGSLGMQLVGEVTMNRVRSKLYPTSVCSVVLHQIQGKYQFSWVQDQAKRQNMLYNIKPKDFNSALDTAFKVYYASDQVLEKDVKFFKVCSVKNEFFKKLQLTRVENLHCFYKQRENTK